MYLSDYLNICKYLLHQYPKLLHESTCVQPLVTGWWFRDIGSARTAVGIRCRWSYDLQRSAL